jgi:hypothetical protein
VANLALVSTPPAVPMTKFATVVVDTGGSPRLATCEILNDPNVIFMGLGVMIHEKTEAKNLVTLSL